MSTSPLGNIVVGSYTAVPAMSPVAVNAPVAGSNSSALVSSSRISVGSSPPVIYPESFTPPAMSTIPLPNKAAKWSSLATVMLPVAVNVPSAGSYNSALAS